MTKQTNQNQEWNDNDLNHGNDWEVDKMRPNLTSPVRKQAPLHDDNHKPLPLAEDPTALWARITKSTDWSTGPLARPFARSLAPLTRSLAPDCSLRSRPPLRSLVRSLAHFTHSLARGKVNDWMAILSVFFSIFDHSGGGKSRGGKERGGEKGEEEEKEDEEQVGIW